MMFELPFDLIVMGRLYPPPPEPTAVVTLLFFMPLVLLEVSSFSLLTLSPAMKLSRYTLFCLGGMFPDVRHMGLLWVLLPVQPTLLWSQLGIQGAEHRRGGNALFSAE